VIIMAITSQIRPDRTFQDVFLEDWQGAGLLRSSAIKPVITTIEQKLVIRKLGQLQSTDRQSLRALLHHLLDD